ncbi:MAG: PP2C family protein-serine/threonine phosphatase [Candidatus Eisenbacteria bacterium]|nr:PP2C family protein-serine/threonine phosphatase [Candidatus Eisenbacteria bacterium]
MNPAVQAAVREQLVDRRVRLERAIEALPDAVDLSQLLQQVDRALSRLDGGEFGVCRLCHGEVEDELLLHNPLIEYCLCDLTPQQQTALEKDLDLAARLQLGLLPRQDLSHAGYTTHFRYEAAGPVSGDTCDLLPRGEETLLFLIGDVSGKGVAASLLMTHLHAAFRSLAATGLGIEKLVERSDRLLRENHIATHYATLVCGELTRQGKIRICNAGHCPPVLIGRDRIRTFDATGFPVGMFGTEPYGVTEDRIEPGDMLFLYTDGLSEARDGSSEEYGTQRLEEMLREVRSLPPSKAASAVLHDLHRFLQGGTHSDDLTMLLIRRED